MEFTINVPNKGQAPGTVGWVRSILETEKLEVSQTRDGEPCLVAVNEYNHNGVHHTEVGKEKPFRQIIAIIGFDQKMGFRDDFATERALHVAYNTSSIPEDNAMFDIPLTPAAENVVQEFIESAASNFYEQWKQDFQEVE